MDDVPSKEKVDKLLRTMLAVYGTLKSTAEGTTKDSEASMLFAEVGKPEQQNLNAWFNDNYSFSCDPQPTAQQAAKLAALHLFEFHVAPAMRRPWGIGKFF